MFQLRWIKLQESRQRAQATTAPAALGIHTLMGERRPRIVRNMSEAIAAGRIAPVEIIARRRRGAASKSAPPGHLDAQLFRYALHSRQAVRIGRSELCVHLEVSQCGLQTAFHLPRN